MATIEANAAARGRGWLIGLWVLTVMVAVFFIGDGITKVARLPFQVEGFKDYGYPQWLLIASGLLDIVGGILVLLPRLATLGAVFIVADMLGAIYTNLTHDKYVMLIPATIFLVSAIIIGWARRNEFILRTW